MNMKFYSLWICLICIFLFILQIAVPSFTDLFILNQNSYYEPWRFLSSIFLHADVGHIAYNMLALVLFGSILERFVGGKRFLIVFFVSGILANLISVNFYNSSLGASGAIMGIIGALVLVRPTMIVWAFNLPMPMFVAGILWAVGDFIGAYGFLTGNPLSNTGNIAHLTGLFIGLIIGLFYRDWSKKEIKSGRYSLDENYVKRWEDDNLR